jgi:hypothetical protein
MQIIKLNVDITMSGSTNNDLNLQGAYSLEFISKYVSKLLQVAWVLHVRVLIVFLNITGRNRDSRAMGNMELAMSTSRGFKADTTVGRIFKNDTRPIRDTCSANEKHHLANMRIMGKNAVSLRIKL